MNYSDAIKSAHDEWRYICYRVKSAQLHLEHLDGCANRENEHAIEARDDLMSAVRALDKLTSTD